MKEISKKDLLFIINESEHEIDELAQEKKLQGIRKEREGKKYTPTTTNKKSGR